MSGDDHYKLLFDKMNEGFALHEIAVDARNRPVNYKFLEINRAFTKMTGITREQAIGRFVTEVLPGIEASTARWIETFGKVAQTGADVSFEEYFGELQKWYLVHAFSPGKNRFAVTFTDVTEKKLLENEVRVSEQKFRALVEQSLTGIYIFDRDRFLYVNSTFCDIFGYEEEEILNHLKPTDVVQDQEYGVARENIRRRLEGEVDSVHYVARGKRKDNKPLWIEIHGTHILLDRTDVITGTVLDITERFESERIIKESENTFRAAFEQSASGMCMTGLDGSLKEVNAPFCAMLGYERDELQGGHFNDITHPEDLEIGKDVIQRMISGEDPKVSFQKRYLKKSGETLWANIHSAVVTDATGKPSHFIVQIEDVTERKRVEMELKTSEELFSKAFNIGPTGLTITRISDGTFMDANASFLEMFGFEREEVLGKTSTALGMWTQEARQKIIDAQVQSGGLVSAELTARAKSGKKIHILFSSKPIDFRGEPVLITSLIDVSAAKQSLEALARSEERYRSLFENMNAGFVLFEAIPAADGKPADLRILAANKGFETTTGLNLTVVRGRCLTEVLPGIEKDEAGWIPTYSRIARMGESLEFEQKSQLLDTYYSVSAFQAGPGQCAVTFTDITHRKRAENEINQLNASLELKVRQRTADLETAIREMEAFSYSVSHDLRAPLRAIGGYSKFLSDEFGTLLNDEGRRFIKVIRDNVTRMDQLISDLLQLSRINTGQFHFSNVSMEEVVQEVITDVLPAVDRNRFRIHVDPLPAVKGNENLLRQVWLNYIGNAVKYSSRSEKKDIVIGAEVQGDEHIFWIRDQGVGFNPLYKDKLFGIFQRLHTQEEFEGTGVGLALVQRIIHRHKGRVWAEGKPNQGATFYFTLPKHANNEGKSG